MTRDDDRPTAPRASAGSRRTVLRATGAIALLAARGAVPAAPAQENPYRPVRPGIALAFPRDHGAHGEFRTEWWYLTGWLRRLDGPGRGQPAGVQITFFRSRTQHDPADPSRFAPLQLLFAHAALALPERGSLLHAQRAARAGLGLAGASQTDTDVSIGAWSLQRGAEDVYRTRLDDASFSLELSFRPRGPPLLQGEAGFSRKGPRESQASYYYSRPQLGVEGSISVGATASAVDGVAWLDHEWSSEILDPQAAGWDWIGLNFDDGTALMAFRIRARDGDRALWADAKRSAGAPGDATRPSVRFEALRHWTSPRTGARYPVSMRVTVDERALVLEPLFDDQELDTRSTTGVVYWEGAVRVLESGRATGRGYLELTGYFRPMKL